MSPNALLPSSHAAPPAAATGPHLAYLDGIRGAAALYVMLHHAWKIWFGPYTQSGPFGFFTNWLLLGGHGAVTVFIVLSGFCLTLPVAASEALRGGVFGFYKRRARRILPPFYAALAISLLLTAVDAAYFDSAKHGLFGRQNLLINALLLQDVLPRGNAFNLPLWSVAVEWKIYFLFPVYIWAYRKGGIRGGAVLSVVLGVLVTALFHRARPDATLFQTCPWYLFSFGMGVGAAWLVVRHNRAAPRRAMLHKGAWAGFYGFAALVWLVSSQTPTGVAGGDLSIRLTPLTDCLLALAAASGLGALYLHVADQKVSQKADVGRPASLRLLEYKPLVFVGMWAYSLYLIHYPLLDLWCRFCTRFFTPLSGSARIVIYLLGGIVLCLGAAYGFFLLVEKPLLKKPRPA